MTNGVSPPPRHQALSCRARAGLGHLSGLAGPADRETPLLRIARSTVGTMAITCVGEKTIARQQTLALGPDHRGILSPASSQIPRSSPWRGPPTGSRAPRHGVVRLGSGGRSPPPHRQLASRNPGAGLPGEGGSHAVGLAVLIARLRALRRPSQPRWLAVCDLPIPGNSVVRPGPSPSRSLSRARASEASEDTGEPRTPRGASATSPPPGTVFREAVTP